MEQKRRGNNRGPTIEDKSVLLVDVSPSTWRIEFFEDRDAVAACAQPNSGSEPAKAGADHDGVRLVRVM
jgi:hypothetical protein